MISRTINFTTLTEMQIFSIKFKKLKLPNWRDKNDEKIESTYGKGLGLHQSMSIGGNSLITTRRDRTYSNTN